MIPIDSIVVRDRLVDPPKEAPEGLVKSMAEVGLINPIGVRKVPVLRDGEPTGEFEIELVHGAKRLTAAKTLGWTEIEANPEPDQDNGELAVLDARLKQITENLHREHWQDAATRAEHLTAWEETLARKRALVDATKLADGIDDTVTPKRGRGRYAKGSGAKAAGADHGITPRTAQRLTTIDKKLTPECKAFVKKHKIQNTDLVDWIARRPAEEQFTALEAVWTHEVEKKKQKAARKLDKSSKAKSEAPAPLAARDRDVERLEKAWDAACPEALYEFMCVERVRTAFMEHLKQSESRAAA
jgi:ParB-like chromosome segregation protein Spo0J